MWDGHRPRKPRQRKKMGVVAVAAVAATTTRGEVEMGEVAATPGAAAAAARLPRQPQGVGVVGRLRGPRESLSRTKMLISTAALLPFSRGCSRKTPPIFPSRDQGSMLTQVSWSGPAMLQEKPVVVVRGGGVGGRSVCLARNHPHGR